jgi:hypothetical protein
MTGDWCNGGHVACHVRGADPVAGEDPSHCHRLRVGRGAVPADRQNGLASLNTFDLAVTFLPSNVVQTGRRGDRFDLADSGCGADSHRRARA